VPEIKVAPAWITSNLTDEQLAPLRRTEQHACIFASAGSGKTRTLVHLVANDLADGVDPASIIAFTFTERAANELRARIQGLIHKHLPELDITTMYIGTIHGWCYQYLLSQQEFYNFEPLDELHMDSLISRLYDQLELAKIYGKPYPKAVTPFIADLEVYYNEHLSLDQIPAAIRPSIYQFTQVLQQNRLLPFGAMITHAVEHLSAVGPLASLQRLYCDEYQDVNPAQVALMQAMIGPETQVVAVGDDLQCIYQWRGSDVSRILHFAHDFPGAALFRLSANYRSRPEIVRAANEVAEDIVIRDTAKVMQPTRREDSLPSIRWLTTTTDQEQAQSIGDAISNLLANGIPANKISILLRSVIRDGQPIADELQRRDIPFESPILGRSGGFVHSFLLPIVEWLTQEHREPRTEQEEEAAYQKQKVLWSTISAWLSSSEDAENRFWDALTDWLHSIESKEDRAYDVRGRLYDFLDRCQVYVTPKQHDLMAGLGIGTQIIRSVEEIHRRRIAGSPRRTPHGLMTEIYHALKRMAQRFGETEPVLPSGNAVLITTVHQAKGLEWPIVILPALHRGHFPGVLTRQQTSYPDEIAGRYGTSLEDERRLFYVAITRARERLILADVAQSTEHHSRFLTDLSTHGSIIPGGMADVPLNYWMVDAADLADPDPEPLCIGLSDLLMAVECTYQFGLRRRANIQPSISEELGYGKGLHELIQRRFEGERSWSSDEMKREVDSYVHLPYMSESEEERARGAIRERLSLFERLNVFQGRLDAEVPVQLAISNALISGIIDGIFQQPDGSVKIRDWKTNIHSDLLPRYVRQLQFYAFTLRSRQITVSDADLVDIGASAKQRSLVNISVDISTAATESLIHLLEQVIETLANGDYTARPSAAACAACDMRRICGVRWQENGTETSKP
jgi:DNA helicase-2/ATP-dependent DNA helicase PcrA